jgi:hypothetical protein
LWYCHKRGREVRLEKERLLTEAEMAKMAPRVAADPPAGYRLLEAPRTAPEGAPIEKDGGA